MCSCDIGHLDLLVLDYILHMKETESYKHNSYSYMYLPRGFRTMSRTINEAYCFDNRARWADRRISEENQVRLYYEISISRSGMKHGSLHRHQKMVTVSKLQIKGRNSAKKDLLY